MKQQSVHKINKGATRGAKGVERPPLAKTKLR